jgi:hypothetical protein
MVAPILPIIPTQAVQVLAFVAFDRSRGIGYDIGLYGS